MTDKKQTVDNQENILLKKIRYYQGTIDDFETFWNNKTEEGEKEESPETKGLKKHNDDLNKAFEIVPVENEETPATSEDDKEKEEKDEKKEEKKKDDDDDDKKKKEE